MGEEGRPGPDQWLAKLFGEAERQAADATEQLVQRQAFGELLARLTENFVGVARIGMDAADLVVRNLRLAGRTDVTRLGRQLARTEDKLERVLQSHAEFLRVEGGRPELVEAIKQHRWRDLDFLSTRERELCTVAEKLSATPSRMVEADWQPLRDLGFDDEALLEVGHIVGIFNYLTRLADGFGLALDAPVAEAARTGKPLERRVRPTSDLSSQLKLRTRRRRRTSARGTAWRRGRAGCSRRRPRAPRRCHAAGGA